MEHRTTLHTRVCKPSRNEPQRKETALVLTLGRGPREVAGPSKKGQAPKGEQNALPLHQHWAFK